MPPYQFPTDITSSIVFFATLIYVSIIYNRYRKGAYSRQNYDYTPTSNPSENPNPFATRPNSLQPDIEVSSYESYRSPVSPHQTNSVPAIPSIYAARSEAYEPLRPGARAPVLPGLDDHASFHDGVLASELEAAERDHASEMAQPDRQSFSPYRAPSPVELVGSPPPPASSIYSQPTVRIA